MQAVSAATRDTADGRAAEIEHFMQTHSTRLVGALTLITGSRGAAEDALQDALAKAWIRRDEPIEQLVAWITVVATNQARSGYRRRMAEERALTKIGSRAQSDEPSPREHDDTLHRALRLLPEREREVTVMHYVLDQSVAQVAAAMGVAVGTVKTLLFRARQHLADELGLDYDTGEGG
ncbi:MAG: sigma-70 family RNA polymerase sigma factor [Ilumatobacteraceae bacterium]